MIEIVYKEEKKEASGNQSFFHLPKNIRQIGECRGNRKIYMEDYVYTFLRNMEEKGKDRGRAGILLGRYNWLDGTAYLFIKSAMEIDSMEVSGEHIRFDDRIWNGIHETMQQYFKDQEILGWVLSLPECSMEINEVILRAHLNHFGGNDKVLFLIEPTEREEAFYSYDSGRLKKEGGFYIYYEKNEPMQNYMIQRNENSPAESRKTVPDQAVKTFRRLVEKKQEKQETKGGHSLLYGVTACVAAASLVLALSYAGGADGLRKIFSGFFMDSGRDGTEIEESVPASGNSVQEILPAAESEISDTPSVTPAVSGDPAADDSSGSSESSGDSTESSSETGEAAGAESSTPETSGASGTGNAGSSVPDVSETAVQGAEYIVRRGDTLSNICEEYYGNLQRIQDICRMNGITANDIIYPGQKIVLPQ